MTKKTHHEADIDFIPLSDAPGPALPLSEASQRALVAAAVERTRRTASIKRPRLQLSAAAAAVLALSLAGSAAAAIAYLRAPSAAEQPAPISAQESAPQKPRTNAPREPAESQETTAAIPAPDAGSQHAARAPSSADLLQRANRLRARGEWRKAERVYAEVARSSAVAHDAYAAQVAAAQLRLTQLDDPRRALSQFRAALRAQPDGALAEEARFGIAEAQRKLGDNQAEARALREFLSQHPNSMLSERARQRVTQLSAADHE